MPRFHPDDMVGQELARLAIAGSPQEAELVEAVLDSASIDYTFEITEYMGGILSGIKSGVMFMVRKAEHEQCVKAMEAAGLGQMLID